MSKYTKLLTQILMSQSDSNILFSDLCHILDKMGFIMRVRGSHHIFIKKGVVEKLIYKKIAAKPNPIKLNKFVILFLNIN